MIFTVHQLRKIVSLAALGVSLQAAAHADLYFEQEVQADPPFKRKVFITDKLLTFQIEDDKGPVAEYGFDFSKNVYYEADPRAAFYKLFDLVKLEEAYRKAVTAARASAHDEIVRELAAALDEGRKDYAISARRSWFSGERYLVRAGPGSGWWNPFGWYLRVEAGATKDIPGYDDYAETLARLRPKAAFYKIKNNRVSKLITVMLALDAFPLRLEYAVREAGDSAKRTSWHERTTFVSTSTLDTDRLLYVRENRRFSWHVVYSKGTDFGPDVSWDYWEGSDTGQTLFHLCFPVFFVVFLYLWVFGGISQEEEFSTKRFVALRLIWLSGAIFAGELAHYFTGLAFFGSAYRELGAASALGIVWIVVAAWRHRAGFQSLLKASELKVCPRCGARIEQFYVICPRCNLEL